MSAGQQGKNLAAKLFTIYRKIKLTRKRNRVNLVLQKAQRAGATNTRPLLTNHLRSLTQVISYEQV